MIPAISQDNIADLLIANTEKVFAVMLDMSVKPRSTTIQKNLDAPEAGVVSLIGFVGQWMGTGSLCCGSELACKIGSQMLMTEFDSVNEEVLDAIGEITNMIIGNFKDAAEPLLGQMGLSTPTVFYGRDFHARNLNGQSWITVTFDCGIGVLDVKVCLVPHNDANTAHCSTVAIPSVV